MGNSMFPQKYDKLDILIASEKDFEKKTYRTHAHVVSIIKKDKTKC